MIPKTELEVINGKTIPFRGVVHEGRQPRDLTSDSITFVVYDPDTLDVKLTKSSDGGHIIRQSDGVYRFNINPNDLNGLSRPEYAFEIELIRNDNGHEVALDWGPFRIHRTPL